MKYILKVLYSEKDKYVELLPTNYSNGKIPKVYFTENISEAQIFDIEEIDSISEWITNEWLGIDNPIEVLSILERTLKNGDLND